MSHPYDASTKYLVETRLADWLPLTGHTTTARLEVIDADLATVTAAADRVLRVHEPLPWLFHVELQASRDLGLLLNLPAYSTILERRHDLRIRTLLVLLRRSADAPELTGVIERGFAGEAPYLTFRYQVLRVWQQPVATFLGGGLGLLPLAPLADVTEADLPAVIGRMEQRLSGEASPEEAGTLWTAADILMGLRYARPVVEHVLRGVRAMKESVTYQGILEEGAVKALHDVILRQGRKRFGNPPSHVEMAVLSTLDLERLRRMLDQLHDLSSWADLLAVA